MEDFNFTASFSQENVDDLVERVQSSIDIDSISMEVFENFDMDDHVDDLSTRSCETIFQLGIPSDFYENVFDNIESSVSDLIDEKVQEVVDDRVEEKLLETVETKIEDVLPDFVSDNFGHFFNEHLFDALDIYHPESSCSIGKLFTSAVSLALDDLLKNDKGIIDKITEIAVANNNNGSVIPNNAPEKNDDAIYPIFDPDFLSLTAVVQKMVDDFLPYELLSDSSFVNALKFDMWGYFVDTRSQYVNHVVESRNKEEGNQ
jgi:hypothetical protein